MKVTVFHASPIDFNEFEVQEQGIHFGSKESAFEAVSRKVTDGKIFLYKVLLDVSQFVEEFDLGYNWYSSFSKEPKYVKGYVYSNKYEPSTKPSYVTWDVNTIELIGKEAI